MTKKKKKAGKIIWKYSKRESEARMSCLQGVYGEKVTGLDLNVYVGAVCLSPLCNEH